MKSVGWLCWVWLVLASPGSSDAWVPPSPRIAAERRPRGSSPPVSRAAGNIPPHRPPPQLIPRQRANSSGGGLSAVSQGVLLLAESLAPKVGVVTSSALYLAPAAAVQAAIRSGTTKDLNPVPLAAMVVAAVAWLAYGLAAGDPYVIVANAGGSLASLSYVVGLLPLLTENPQPTQAVVLGGAAASLGLWAGLGLAGASLARTKTALGAFASVWFVLLSASPLSTIRRVVATRTAASILWPLTAAQVTNTCLWSAYGLSLGDPFVWGPNLVGLGLGLVQLALKLVFPAPAKEKDP